MPAARNPIHPMVSQIIKDVHASVRKSIHGTPDIQIGEGGTQHARDLLNDGKFLDIQVHFIGASGLPRMDIVGTADPYFVARIDGEITYTFVLSVTDLRSCSTR